MATKKATTTKAKATKTAKPKATKSVSTAKAREIKKSVSARDAGAKAVVAPTDRRKKKARGVPFAKGNTAGESTQFQEGEDPRRNVHGQRNKKAVRLTTEMRNLFVDVLNEPSAINPEISNLEFGIRRQVKEGVSFNDDSWEAALNRTWGNSKQTIETSGDDDPLGDSVSEEDRNKRLFEIFQSTGFGATLGSPIPEATRGSEPATTKSGKRRRKAAG